MSQRKVSVSSKRKVLTYNYLHEGSCLLIEQAEASEEGSFYNRMSAIILSAFCVEAYLNHIGTELLPYWDIVERRLSSREKVELLGRHLHLPVDFSRRPFQSLKTIFDFRNSLAHGKTEDLSDQGIQTVSESGRVKYPQADWEKLCTLENAKRLLADTEEMIVEIHRKAGFGEHPFGCLGHATASIGPVHDDLGQIHHTQEHSGRQ